MCDMGCFVCVRLSVSKHYVYASQRERLQPSRMPCLSGTSSFLLSPILRIIPRFCAVEARSQTHSKFTVQYKKFLATIKLTQTRLLFVSLVSCHRGLKTGINTSSVGSSGMCAYPTTSTRTPLLVRKKKGNKGNASRCPLVFCVLSSFLLIIMLVLTLLLRNSGSVSFVSLLS